MEGMNLKEQIYQSERKLQIASTSIENDGKLTKNNIKQIMAYRDHCLAKGLTPHRVLNNLRRLKSIGEMLEKDFETAERSDYEQLFANLRKRMLKSWTMHTYQSILKTFYRWLFELERDDKLPKSISWLKGEKPPNEIEKKDLLTTEEIGLMITATSNIQHKALISVLYEGALRPGELMTIERKHITKREDCFVISVGGKMERKAGRRDVYLFNSYNLLNDWLKIHPLKTNDNYPLWIGKNKRVFGMRFLFKMLKGASKSANIKKRVYPYLFRHSRATELYIDHGEAVAKKYMGHERDSRMASVYNHLCDEDVYEALSGKKKQRVADTRCSKCGTKNSYCSEVCSKCGLSLSIVEASKPKLNEDQVKAVVESMLRSMGYDVTNIVKL